VAFAGLDEFLSLSDESEADWEHTVSWIDCTSGGKGAGSVMRGLFMRARQATGNGTAWRERRRRLPFTPPLSLVNGLSLKPFNALYYNVNRRRTGLRTVHYEPFLYPLDSILDWNRLYGPAGFFQYQSVVPREAAVPATYDMLNAIAAAGNKEAITAELKLRRAAKRGW
jgi:hypothetical protein